MINSSLICLSNVRFTSLTLLSPFQDFFFKKKKIVHTKHWLTQIFYFPFYIIRICEEVFYRNIKFIGYVLIRNKSMPSPQTAFRVFFIVQILDLWSTVHCMKQIWALLCSAILKEVWSALSYIQLKPWLYDIIAPIKVYSVNILT
jgi:hypothetical protein